MSDCDSELPPRIGNTPVLGIKPAQRPLVMLLPGFGSSHTLFVELLLLFVPLCHTVIVLYQHYFKHNNLKKPFGRDERGPECYE